MRSLVFMLPDHHIIMVHFTLTCIGMTSLCSHCVHIAHVMSSHFHHDVIAFTHESQLQSWHVTDRPSYVTGRPSHDLKEHNMSNPCKHKFDMVPHGMTSEKHIFM